MIEIFVKLDIRIRNAGRKRIFDKMLSMRWTNQPDIRAIITINVLDLFYFIKSYRFALLLSYERNNDRQYFTSIRIVMHTCGPVQARDDLHVSFKMHLDKHARKRHTRQRTNLFAVIGGKKKEDEDTGNKSA